MHTTGILQADDVATPVVSNVFDGSGELIAGVASVETVVRFLQQYSTVLYGYFGKKSSVY